MEGSQMVSLEGDKNSHLDLQTQGFNSFATAAPGRMQGFWHLHNASTLKNYTIQATMPQYSQPY